ncbi:MAG: EAL domain-containing protein, partial [Magnetococcales bacterium]|nr:EAL domain-containing protein [Magnetococcales bacterium]
LVVNFPDHNHGYLLLKDSLGEEAILVKTSMDRKIYEMGQVGVQLLLYSSLIILIALVGFSLFFDRIILRPVSLLNQEIAQVAGVADLDMHVTVPPGNNEFTELTTSINGMLQRLSNAMVDLQSSQEKLRLAAAAIENSTDLVAITDSNNKIIMVNHGFCEVSGYTPEEVVGKSPNILQSGIHGFEFYADMWRILLKDGHWHGEITNRRKNGELFPEWLTISVVRNAEGEIENFIAIGTDLTARKEADRRIALLANHDQLTGLPNRILLQDRLTQAILNSRIYHRMAGLLLIGLDRFKHLNDSLGHNYGDELLRQVGERLTSLVARDVTVARMSGDTFAVVLSFHDAQFAARTANDILETLAKPFQIYENEVILTASIGISLFPNDGEVADELMRHGEQAMFRAKSQGRNSFGFYENHMQEDAKERFHLERNLRRAIENNELFLYYQPQYEVSGQHLVGAEALIRWKHPQLGMVSPGKFIPVAEESGLVVPIGNWVLETVCRRLRAWQEEGLQLVTVAVNVSALQFRQAGFVDFVKHCLAINHLHPSLLELEVTESMLIQNVTQTVDILNQLKKLGIRLAIDDFGTGYSSLHYLNRFPLDKLKVDQSFIRGLPTYEDNAAITTAIIQLARNLRLRVIAEGVETQGELKFLQAHQCDEIQGYLFSRPLPMEEFAKKLVSQI